MSLLDEIIDGASSEGVSTANLLRKVQTVAHRLDAADLRQWVRSELQGYAADATLPEYRGPFTTHVEGVYSGPFGSGGTNMVSPAGVPEKYLDLFEVGWRVSIVEIEQLSKSESEIAQPWDPHSIAKYNEWIDAGRVPRISMLYLYSARKLISRAMLGSIVESVRTNALELALDLQRANPAAGEEGGPTLTDSKVLTAVTNNTFNIYGDGANVALGAGITQTSTVSAGDLNALLKALEALTTDPELVRQSLATITSDESQAEKKSKLQMLGAAITSGAGTVAGGAAGNVVADRLLELARQFLGW